MAIEKLIEFAKDGQKNIDDLNLTDGFHVSKKPARQWFNWLFNSLTSKVNEIIDADFVPKADIVDNLTTDDAKRPVSAKQAKNLQDNKLDKTANAVSSSKLETARTISFSGAATGSFNFDGSGNSSCVLALANSGVVASTYGAALKIPVLTVNAKGLITGVSEQNIPMVDDLTTDDGNKPLSARQGKKLQDEKFSKSGGQLSGKLTTKPSYLAQNLDDIGAGDNSPLHVPRKIIPFDTTGYIPFVHGSMHTAYSGYATQISIGGYRGSNTWENSGAYIAVGGNDAAPTEAFMFLNGRKISNTAGPIDLIGNASSANKFAIPRNVFGQTFDGSSDIGGTVTASTGLMQSGEYHYIDMGRNGLDRMNFYNYGAIFNFIDSENGNVVARITQNGIDCNAASASKLKTPRKINGVNFDGSTDIDLPLIGVNQTWQNLTASRAAETIYTNTTGKPIQVAISYNGNNAYFDIGGVEIYMPDYTAFGFAFFIIPNGTTYRIRNQIGINSWSELR